MAFTAQPNEFPEFGISESSDDAAIARAVARWLSERHHGYSGEWTTTARRQSMAGAVAHWADRYLRRPAGGGSHMIERARDLAVALNPLQRRVPHLLDHDREALQRAVHKRTTEGVRRYRMEVWTNRLLRAVKELEPYHERRGTPLAVRLAGDQREVEVELQAQRMQAWPYGKGGWAQYREFRRLLQNLNDPDDDRPERHDDPPLLTWSKPYVSPSFVAPGAPEIIEGHATAYWVRASAYRPRAAELRIVPWVLRDVLQAIPGPYGGPWTLDEGYHALWLIHTRQPLSDLYGRNTRELIQELGDGVRARVTPGVVRPVRKKRGTTSVSP